MLPILPVLPMPPVLPTLEISKLFGREKGSLGGLRVLLFAKLFAPKEPEGFEGSCGRKRDSLEISKNKSVELEGFIVFEVE